jgi:hypothetical protein
MIDMGMDSWRARFRRDPTRNTLLLSVILIHLFFVLAILLSPTFTFHKKEHKSLIVKTVTLKAPHPAIIEKKNPHPRAGVNPKAASPKPVQKSIPVPKTQEMPRTQASPKKEKAPMAPPIKKEPAIADKQLSKNKQPPAKKNLIPQNRAKISDSLLQELEESIAKIENKSDKGAASKKTPVSSKPLAPISLQIDTPSAEFSSVEDGQSDYADTLVSHLHQCLSLPDYGEVKIQLSLRQDGTVVKVVVLKAQSEKNKQYLESNLSRLRFPRFEGVYASKKESTFTLTFCNEL